jgi:hypothetical protein
LLRKGWATCPGPNGSRRMVFADEFLHIHGSPTHLLSVHVANQRLLADRIFLAHAASLRQSFYFARCKFRGFFHSFSPDVRLSDYTSKWNLLGKMQMCHRRKSCGALRQYLRCWKRWVMSGVRFVLGSDAFKCPVNGTALSVSAPPTRVLSRPALG